MSKKLNLFSKCLALTNYWFFNFQIFGKKFFLFKIFYFKIFYFKKLFNKKKLFYLNFFFILNIQFFILKNYFFICLSLFHLKKKINLFFQFIFSIWNFQKKYFLPLKLKIFIVKNFYLSSFFLKNLIFYLLFDKKFNPKKIFNFVFNFLKKNLNSHLISSLDTNILKKNMVGFKMQLKGRFEITKNSMSKKFLVKFGKISSTTLVDYIVFYEHIFFSKLGLSSLKICLFYKNKIK